MGDQGGDPEAAMRGRRGSVSELLDALDLPRPVVARWMDHLDAFFARHGGARRYGGLGRLTAETRTATRVQPRGAGGKRV